jgi:hypothetical protein
MGPFIANTLGFEPMPVTVHPTLTMQVHDFRHYRTHGHIITLSETQLNVDVPNVVLNGPTTADMTFMSCGGLATFYPDLTLNRMGVRSQNGQRLLLDTHSAWWVKGQ